MKNSFTKELIELSAQTASIEQLNVVIKARDIRIKELEEHLASAKADGIREAMQYATSNHTKGVRVALRKYIELLEGKS
jgi:hypothetical protein